MLLNDQVDKLNLKILYIKADVWKDCGVEPNRSVKKGAMAIFRKTIFGTFKTKKSNKSYDVSLLFSC